jgi:hypothetical protein
MFLLYFIPSVADPWGGGDGAYLSLCRSAQQVQRSFSTLRRLETWMRSRMAEDRLTGLTILNVHRDISVNVDKVIDRFAKIKKRLLDFVL